MRSSFGAGGEKMREKAQKGSFRVSPVITVATRAGHRELKHFTASFSTKLSRVDVGVGKP